MTRDTAGAIWYRRLDPRCFTRGRQAPDADGRPLMEASYEAVTEHDGAVHASSVSDHWPSPAVDRRGWSVEAAADRL